MESRNIVKNKKVEITVGCIVFLYIANFVWYFMTGIFGWGEPLLIYLIFIANAILFIILYIIITLISCWKIKISPKNNKVLKLCLIIFASIFMTSLIGFKLIPNVIEIYHTVNPKSSFVKNR